VSVLKVVKYGDPVLAQKTRAVTAWDDRLELLVRDMVDTMHAAHGIGLAANQVGEATSLAIIDLEPEIESSDLWVMTNPEMVESKGCVKEEEGCLSIPGLVALVERPEKVVVRFRDLRGDEQFVEASGLLARALCHELDHLAGVLFPQRIAGIRGDLVRRRARKMQEEDAWKDVEP
jgi:peptide deformylase